jgi:ketosteroid isomerase-like protein
MTIMNEPISRAPESQRNEAVMAAICAEFAEGKTALFVESLDDSARWTGPGVTTWARTYDGKASVLGDLLRPVSSQFQSPFRAVTSTIVASGDRVVVEMKGSGNVTKGGARYDNAYCWVCRMKDGKIVDVVEYCDTELATRVLGSQEKLAARPASQKP